jgi:Geranylgeranyl pyrophosphate synthase
MKNVDLWLQETTQSYLDTRPESTLKKAIAYALGGTGKKLRPKLMLSIIQSKGEDMKPYLNAALALELVHTYSLVHDDLPAMDDDDLRRGQPTTHIKFDEATAILVGDALLSDTFHLIASTQEIPTEIRLNMVDILSKKIGSTGMVYGQTLDMKVKEKSRSYPL